MSVEKIPQYSDVQLVFDNIQYDTDPTEIDLSTMDDVIVSVSQRRIDSPEVVLKNTTDSDRFTIDNTDKKITVIFTSSEITQTIGRYYVNLWLLKDDRYLTHLTQEFDVVAAVKYE